ncbi:MAG: thiamine-phosphate kinase [Deltaproteobacteria bacterium]|nr:MAG: thiamine-phosphate kinase [Deltaproteobacteria bacterium]
MDEFELIERWLERLPVPGSGVLVGPGDDAAVLVPRPGHRLVVTTDAVVEGVHFDAGRVPPAAIGHKALAVNLSDLAAMGARPRWSTVALTLPPGRLPWSFLRRIADGLGALARAHGVAVVGGNVSAGDVFSLTLTLVGEARQVLRRKGARPGDRILVTGTLGDAALGLASLAARSGPPRRMSVLEARQVRPTPRVEMGLAAVGLASAAIDVSDGLVQDLGHLLRESGVGATLFAHRVPRSRAYQRATTDLGPALSGGEDYELCLTAPPRKVPALSRRARALRLRLTEIGEVDESGTLRILDDRGRPIRLAQVGYTHHTLTRTGRGRRRRRGAGRC